MTTTTALRFVDLGGHMGVAAEDLDLNETLDRATQHTLRMALLEKLVLCIRGQRLAGGAYRDAVAHFGTPVVRRQVTMHGEIPEISILSSEDRDTLGDGKRIVVGAHWHSDDSFRAVPCSLTMLYGVAVPSVGGDTQFTNMYAAYEALPPAMQRRIHGLRVVHTYDSSRKGTRITTRSAEEMAEMPPVVHPLVRTHPETLRKALYMNPNRMERILDLPREESDALLDELTAHATQERFQYRHKWRQGDILIWDNRCTMHKANADYPEGEKRLMHRIVIEGSVPV